MNGYTCIAIVVIFVSLGSAVSSKYESLERIKEIEVEAEMVQEGYKKIYHKWYESEKYHWEKVLNSEESR